MLLESNIEALWLRGGSKLQVSGLEAGIVVGFGEGTMSTKPINSFSYISHRANICLFKRSSGACNAIIWHEANECFHV